MFRFYITSMSGGGGGGGGGGRVVIPRTEVASKNSPAFRELCDALKRNDPNVTAVTTPAERTSTPDAYGRRLGTALTNNTVVTEIALNLATFLSQTDQQAGTTNSAVPLVQWISQSPSLHTIKLRYDAGHGGHDENDLEPVEELLLERILDGMATNPRIQTLDSSLTNARPRLLTEYLRANPVLKSLRITLMSEDDDDDDDDDDDEDDDLFRRTASENQNLEAKAAAEAIGALASLEKLFLHCDDVFLSLLSKSTTPRTRPATELLCELSVDFMNEANANVQLFADVLTSATQLVSVGIQYLTLSVGNWTLVSSALGSNAAITTLKVDHCWFEYGGMALFLQHMQSADASRQHVRHLELTECDGEDASIVVKIAEMLRGSLLNHITLDSDSVPEDEELEFFAALALDTNQVRLRSLKLNDMSENILRHVSQSLYLAITVHLQRLSIQTDIGSVGDGGGGRARVRRVPFMNAFLATLHRNGSLHHVEIITCNDESSLQTDLLADVLPTIEAYTARNRLLPELLKTSFASAQEDGDASSSSSLPTSLTSSGALFATLCQVADQAPCMSPNTLLMGLQSASQSLNGATAVAAATAATTNATAARATTGKRVRAPAASASASAAATQNKGAARKKSAARRK